MSEGKGKDFVLDKFFRVAVQDKLHGEAVATVLLQAESIAVGKCQIVFGGSG